MGRPWALSISAGCGCLRLGLPWPHSIVAEWVYLPILQTGNRVLWLAQGHQLVLDLRLY